MCLFFCTCSDFNDLRDSVLAVCHCVFQDVLARNPPSPGPRAQVPLSYTELAPEATGYEEEVQGGTGSVPAGREEGASL